MAGGLGPIRLMSPRSLLVCLILLAALSLTAIKAATLGNLALGRGSVLRQLPRN
jgi:hypothetical protein